MLHGGQIWATGSKEAMVRPSVDGWLGRGEGENRLRLWLSTLITTSCQYKSVRYTTINYNYTKYIIYHDKWNNIVKYDGRIMLNNAGHLF